MKRHIFDHLLSLFQLALPPRSDVLDAASIGNTSKVDAETRRDPLDESFNLIDGDYIDQQYVDPPLYLDENIPATLDDDSSFSSTRRTSRPFHEPSAQAFH